MFDKINLIIILILLLFVLGCSQTTEEKLAQCLSENGAIMYGTDWCHYCSAQKELFGGSFKYINYVDCEVERDRCDAKNVHSYPTWEISNQFYSGKRSLANLASLSGCK